MFAIRKPSFLKKPELRLSLFIVVRNQSRGALCGATAGC
jgi:hypothetical protein